MKTDDELMEADPRELTREESIRLWGLLHIKNYDARQHRGGG